MPNARPREGTSEWFEWMEVHPDKITFYLMNQHPRLMRVYVNQCCRLGDEDGLVKKNGRPIPEGFYLNKDGTTKKPTPEMLRETKRCMGFHRSMPFLRSGAVLYAIKKCREYGWEPYKMNKATLPRHAQKKGWCNYGKFCHVFTAFYCYAQGLTRSQDVYRQVQLYVCHGKGLVNGKHQSVISVLHKRVQSGRHRFTAVDKIEARWARVIALLSSHPTWVRDTVMLSTQHHTSVRNNHIHVRR